MNHSRAAVRYAKATLDLCREKKALEAVDLDMRAVLKAIEESDVLRDMLASPLVEGATKKKALDNLFKGQHAISKGLISLLVENKRIAILADVALKYIILYEELKGKDIAFLTTAVPLTPEIERKALARLAKITDKEVTLKNKVDKGIIGGFILRVGDVQFDASIASKLNTIKREFTKSL